jgi:peroxiredoxin
VISPELPARTADMAAKQSLNFPILWDKQSKVAQAFSLSLVLPEDLKQVYLGFGNDLAVRNGDLSWQLPVPSRFVVDGEGIVRSVQADPDYTYRPEAETTLAALRKLVEG